MKNTKSEKRFQGIVELVKVSGYATTEELSSAFNVTPQTIRRDIAQLSERGDLVSFHGGAGLTARAKNTPYIERQKTESAEKKQIAEAAAKLVPNNASLFLNIGTTTEAVARALLNHQNLHVTTNNFNVALILKENPSFSVNIAGGRIRNHDSGIVGQDTTEFMDKFRLDMCIIGISGIDEDGTLLDFDSEEIHTAQVILRNSKQTILVADSQKFGRRAMHRLGHISELDVIITNRKVPAALSLICDENDVQIVDSSA